MTRVRVAVVGAGISGLGVSHVLARAGVPFRLLESSSSVGGMIRSERVDGFLAEHGPNSALNSSRQVEAVLEDLGVLPQRVFASAVARKRYVVKDSRPVPLPMSVGQFLRTPLWSGRGKRRLLREPFIARFQGGEESIASFVERRLGREILEYAVDPFVSGVYAGDPDRLSVQATFPKLAEWERRHGSLLRGAIAHMRNSSKPRPARRGIYSFADGMSRLPAAIGRSVGDALWLNSRVHSLTVGPSSVRLQVERDGAHTTLEAETVVLATPASDAGRLVRPFAADLAEELESVIYAPVAVVFTGFRRQAVEHPLDGFGCLVPRRERQTILGSLWSSSLFPDRAPEGTVLLSNFVGGARHPEFLAMEDRQLLDAVVTDLARLVGVKEAPIWSRITRHHRAIPQYDLGHAARVERIEQAAIRFGGRISIVGNYLRGVAVGDCLERGLVVGGALSTR